MEAPVPRKSGGAIRKGNRDLYAGNMSVNYPRNGMEVASVFDPLTGLYSDMEGIEAIYDHVFYQSIDVDPKDRPLLLCEPSCNTGTSLGDPTTCLLPPIQSGEAFSAHFSTVAGRGSRIAVARRMFCRLLPRSQVGAALHLQMRCGRRWCS